MSMINYLINATTIWLLGQLVFECLLKRNNLHRWNRVYLLAAFAMGALLPLVKWSVQSVKPEVAHQYKTTITHATYAVQSGMATPAQSWDAAAILLVVYLVGVLVGLVLLAGELMRLLWLARYGYKKEIGGITVIETRLNHPPFSFFSGIFIGRLENYSLQELRFIVTHELAHRNLKHSLDKLLMQLCRIVFWFHPLVWRYQKMLLLVHEYQADEVAAAGDTVVYGRFVVAQAMLKGAPSISNPFNYSPVKKRIRMMTQNQGSGLQGWKYLLMLPLAACSVLFFSQVSFSGDVKRNGKFIYVNGHTLVKDPLHTTMDTIRVASSAESDTAMMVNQREARITTLDGQKLWDNEEANAKAAFGIAGGSIEDYLTKQILSEMKELPRGEYLIVPGTLVLDAKGKVIYVDECSIMIDAASSIPVMVEPKMVAWAEAVLYQLIIDMPDWKPAERDGKKIPVALKPYPFTLTK